jgi:hypothetical protein
MIRHSCLMATVKDKTGVQGMREYLGGKDGERGSFRQNQKLFGRIRHAISEQTGLDARSSAPCARCVYLGHGKNTTELVDLWRIQHHARGMHWPSGFGCTALPEAGFDASTYQS